MHAQRDRELARISREIAMTARLMATTTAVIVFAMAAGLPVVVGWLALVPLATVALIVTVVDKLHEHGR